mmetsp:Transcript_69685/g.197476  ORF Transcript_69685/g.197476 Transcript_69685/m.197476 type:complete len:133 (-) Transcript_69685:106-504(-)
MDTLIGLYIEADMFFVAVKECQNQVTVLHQGGDMQGEGKALVKLGNILLQHEDHDKARKIAEAALGIFAGINDMEGLQSAKELLDASNAAKTVEDIGMAMQRAADFMHVPSTLVVDPGLSRRIGDAYASAMR